MHSILVVGAGMVGSTMAVDLAKKHAVTLSDFQEEVLKKVQDKHPSLAIKIIDVTQKESFKKVLLPYDLIICAVPGFLGFETLKSILEAGKNVVDISFFPENALELELLAREKKVTAVVDCGVAPGMGNIILGHYNEQLKIDTFECFVGGLPVIKKWPFSYKAPFSPIDVIEEYTRPARYIENGFEVVKEALSDCELMEFEHIGTLEAFNSDGLRSLIYTMPHIPNMKEKTLRYPGHVEYIKVLKESGFFNSKSIIVNGKSISPLTFTSAILFEEWKLKPQEEEFTVMKIQIKGKNTEGKKLMITYDLYDRYCAATDTSSMARTTGYTATAVANLILENKFTMHGIFPPELLGKQANCFEFVLKYLQDRGVNYTKTELFF